MEKQLFALILIILSYNTSAGQSINKRPNDVFFTQHKSNWRLLGFTLVEQAKISPNESWVVLEGKLVKHAAYETYEFSDCSGTILVRIRKRIWQGKTDIMKDSLLIEGYLNKDKTPMEIDVKSIFSIPSAALNTKQHSIKHFYVLNENSYP